MGVLEDLPTSVIAAKPKTSSAVKSSVTSAPKVGGALSVPKTTTVATSAPKVGAPVKSTTPAKSLLSSSASKAGAPVTKKPTSPYTPSKPSRSTTRSTDTSSTADPVGAGPTFGGLLGLVGDPIYGNRGTPGTNNGGMIERDVRPSPTLTQEQLLALDAMLKGTHDRLDPSVRYGGPTSVAEIYEGILPAAPSTGDERLASEPVPAKLSLPYMPPDPDAPAAYIDSRTSEEVPSPLMGIDAALVPPLPRARPPTPMNWEDIVYGEGPAPSAMPEVNPRGPVEGLYTGADLGRAPGTTEDPSVWDKVVDGGGKILENSTLGKIVSTLFPDVWNGIGGAVKGFDDPGHTHTPNPFMEESDGSRHRREARRASDDDDDGSGTPRPRPDKGDTGGGGGGVGNPDDPDGESPFPPIVMPPGTSLFTRTAQFPDLPPYRPGVDPEWRYFDYLNMPGWARGGIVGYADGGAVNPLAGQDPRVEIIAAAEDALHNAIEGQPEADDESDIGKFVETFGADALEKLKANVAAGMKMRPGKKGRMVKGPGGPTDDAVPAVIDGRQPAALSSGEFVMSADAVAGAGEGDPEVGAQKLQQLHAALAGKAA